MSVYDLREGFEEYLSQREHTYLLAVETPLRSGSLLQASSVYSFDYRAALGNKATFYLDYSCPNVLKDVETLLPALYGVRRTRPAVNPDTSTSFSLVRPLQAGAGKWSQVWLASCYKEGNRVAAVNEHVVVKLFQESLFPIPDLADYGSGFVASSRAYPHKESWAFCALQKLQGTFLPYSLGFFRFVLPCGESVCGHVMEFVVGRTLQRDYSAMLDKSYEREYYVQQRCLLIEKFTCAIHLVHSLGVAHGDLSPRNVLLPSVSGGSFVILDWSQAQPAYTPYSVVANEWGGLRDCLEEIGPAAMVVTWVSQQKQAGAPWTEMLGDSPEEISWRLEVLENCAASTESDFQERAELLRMGLEVKLARDGLEQEEADQGSEIDYEFPDGAFVPDTHGAW